MNKFEKIKAEIYRVLDETFKDEESFCKKILEGDNCEFRDAIDIILGESGNELCFCRNDCCDDDEEDVDIELQKCKACLMRYLKEEIILDTDTLDDVVEKLKSEAAYSDKETGLKSGDFAVLISEALYNSFDENRKTVVPYEVPCVLCGVKFYVSKRLQFKIAPEKEILKMLEKEGGGVEDAARYNYENQ